MNAPYSFVEARDESFYPRRECRFTNVACIDNHGEDCLDGAGYTPQSEAECTKLSNLRRECSFTFTCSRWAEEDKDCKISEFTLCGMLSTQNRRCQWQTTGRCETICPSALNSTQCEALEEKKSYDSNCKGAACTFDMPKAECERLGCEFFAANPACMWHEVIIIDFLFCKVSCLRDTIKQLSFRNVNKTQNESSAFELSLDVSLLPQAVMCSMLARISACPWSYLRLTNKFYSLQNLGKCKPRCPERLPNAECCECKNGNCISLICDPNYFRVTYVNIGCRRGLSDDTVEHILSMPLRVRNRYTDRSNAWEFVRVGLTRFLCTKIYSMLKAIVNDLASHFLFYQFLRVSTAN